MQATNLTFLTSLVDPTREGNDSTKAMVNAHIARHSHRKRRARQQLKNPHQRFESLRKSQIPQSLLHRDPCIPRCFWCEQMVNCTTVTTYCGNSDPFDSLPVTIDAKANFYLSIGRALMGPLVRGTGPPDLVMNPGQAPLTVAADPEVQNVKSLPLYTVDRNVVRAHIPSRDLFVGQLDLDRFASLPPGSASASAHAYSILAYCANALSSITTTPQHLMEALQYTSLCMKGLRQCLEMDDDVVDIEELVYRLLRAEIIGNNYSNARIHAKYLQRLVQRKIEIGESLDPDSLTMIVHTDNYLALCTRSLPSFHPSWLHEAFADSWRQLDSLFPGQGSYDIEYRAPSRELQDLLVAENKLFQQSEMLQKQGTATTRTNWHWMLSQREHLQNCLLHYDAELVDDSSAPDMGKLSIEALLEQSLLLTAIIAARIRLRVLTVGGVALSRALRNLASRIGSTFDTLELKANEDWFQEHIQPMIWITFVVAIMEAKPQSYSLALQTGTPWLARLREYIGKAGLRNWSELLVILTRFPYAEQMLPLPRKGWLDDLFARE